MLVCSWIIWSKFDTSKNVSHIFNNYFPVSSLLFEPLPSRYHVPSLAWKNFLKLKIKYINNFPRWKNQCTCKKLYLIALISKLYQNSNWFGGERVNEGGFPVKEFHKISFRTGKPYPYTTISQSWTNGQCFWCVKHIFSPRRTRCTMIDFGQWFQDNFHLTIRSLRNPSLQIINKRDAISNSVHRFFDYFPSAHSGHQKIESIGF